jgi:hypothetical protein
MTLDKISCRWTEGRNSDVQRLMDSLHQFLYLLNESAPKSVSCCWRSRTHDSSPRDQPARNIHTIPLAIRTHQ